MFCCLCGCKLKACCFVLRLWGGELVVCIMPLWQQACSFVLRLCGGKKEKIKRRGFVACMAVILLCCIAPVGRQACSLYHHLCGGETKKIVLLPV